MPLQLNSNMSVSRRSFVSPLNVLTPDHYYTTASINGDDELVDVKGDTNIAIIGEYSLTADGYLDGDTIIDLSGFGTTYDKSYYDGNSEGKATNWDYPFTYFDAANTTHWKISELNKRRIEAQYLANSGDLQMLYAKLIFENESLQGMQKLLIYNSQQTEETKLKNYIGVLPDYYGDELISNGGGVDQTNFIDSDSDGLADSFSIEEAKLTPSIEVIEGDNVQVLTADIDITFHDFEQNVGLQNYTGVELAFTVIVKSNDPSPSLRFRSDKETFTDREYYNTNEKTEITHIVVPQDSFNYLRVQTFYISENKFIKFYKFSVKPFYRNYYINEINQ